MQQMRKPLRRVSVCRTVGLKDAVADLGTHKVHGVDVPFTECMVWNVLKGKMKSERMLKRIAERRPDLFGVWYCCDAVKEWAAANGVSVPTPDGQGAGDFEE